jgi:hypothetical protein
MTTSATWTVPTRFRQQCLDLYGLTCPPMWGTPRRPDYPTLGGKAAKVMTALGYPPMPWQRYGLDVALEIDPETGLLAYREVGLSVPRQQGKTQKILGLMVHRAMAWQRQNIVYAAQTRGMARTRWEDEFIATLDVSKLHGKYHTRKSNGHEAILWGATRSRIGITANTEKAGHGPPLDEGIIDEAFAHEDGRLEQAFSPAMITRDNAQLVWASAGGTEKSAWLNGKRMTGRALIEELWRTGIHPGVAYMEWFAPDELDRKDPATWRICMPALGYTVTEAVIKAELEKMPAAEFDRAYLNRTKKSVPPADPNIPTVEWALRDDRASLTVGPVAAAIDVTRERDRASITIYGLRADGLGHVEVIDTRPGTAWVVPALVRLKLARRLVGIGVDSVGPAASLHEDMEKAGLAKPVDPEKPAYGDVAMATTRDVVNAFGQFVDAIRHDRLRHIDQPELNQAINGAQTRSVGDGLLLARRTATTDISPAVAGTIAKWVYETRAHLVSKPYDPLANIH